MTDTIYSISGDLDIETARDIRNQFVAYLEREQRNYEAGAHTSIRVALRREYEAKAKALQDAADFWRKVVI